jgi:glycogen debranching enzyme
VPEQAEIQFGREISSDLAAAESREWLVTNGIGGYASGTVAGSLTRRYHGLLIAALEPPGGARSLLPLSMKSSTRREPAFLSPRIAGREGRSIPKDG